MRQVAVHVWVKEILEGWYEEKEGWEPNILHTGRGDLTRCNVMGVVFDQAVLDDGTGSITIRSFDEKISLSAYNNSFVQIIGRPREYNGSLFLSVELIKQVNPLWGAVRKKELGAVMPPVQKPVVKNNVISESDNKAEKIISIVSGLDEGDGVFIDDVINNSGLGKEAERIIEQLLLDGELFEIRPGVLKPM